MSRKKQELKGLNNGFEKLGEAVKDLELAIPHPQIPDLIGLDDGIEAMAKAMAQIREGVASALKYLKDAKAKIAKYIGDKDKQKIARSQVSKGIEDMNQYLKDILASEKPIFKQTAAIAYIKAALSVKFENNEEACEALHELEDRKIVEIDRSGKGPIIIGHQHYLVPEAWGFESDDIDEISEAIAKFSRDLKALKADQIQETTRELEAEADITLEDALAGEDGKALLKVPPESYIDRKTGEEKWRGGGKLLVKFTKMCVAPVAAAGAIERVIAEMTESGVQLQRYTLDWETPPGTGKTAFDRVLGGVMRNMHLGETEAEAYVNRMRSFWFMIHRAVGELNKMAEAAEQEKKFSEAATISPEEFFGLNGHGGPIEGITMLKFEGQFRVRDRSFIASPFILVEYSQENDGMVKVLEVPEYLKEVLGQFAGKKFPAADNFRSCPDPLGRVIRAIRSKHSQDHDIARSKAESEARASEENAPAMAVA